jgi:O-antigen/teichoic acid export membrane protein
VVALVMSYRMHPFRPRFSLAARGSLLSFSGWIFAQNIVKFVRLRGAALVIGRMEGPAALGIFNMAYEISNLPTSEIVMPINRAVLPGYARWAGDVEKLRRGLLQVTAVVALFAVPAAAGVAVLASLIVPVMLGGRWVSAVPVIQWLAIFGATISVQSNLQSLYQAIGKPRLAFTRALINIAFLIPLLLWLVPVDGVRGAAIAYLLASLLSMPFNYHNALKATQTAWSALLGVMIRPVVAAIVMYLVLQRIVPAGAANMGTWQALPWLLGCTALGAAIYVVVELMLWLIAGRPQGAETFVLDKLKALVAHLRLRSRRS